MGGREDNFNIAVSGAKAGFEIRPVPEEPFEKIIDLIVSKVNELDLSCEFLNREPGVSANVGDRRLGRIIEAASTVTGRTAESLMGFGKPHGTQARFAPAGCVPIVWGQAGVGPHSANEAHYIPSIKPFYQVLRRLAVMS